MGIPSGSVCTTSNAYLTESRAEHCRPIVERETGSPYLVQGYIDGDPYGHTLPELWWELDEFEGCYAGAVFDGWFSSNYETAKKCVESLNNIAGGQSYYVKLFQENFILSNYYSVEQR